MERRAAKSTNHENDPQRQRRHGQPNHAHDDHRKERAADDKHARLPAIGERAEPELRDRVGQLEAHRQDARHRQRQAQVRDQQRQHRRVHVVVGVDDDVGRRHFPDRRVQSEPAAVLQPTILFSRPSTRSRASPYSSMRSNCAAAISTAIEIVMVVSSRMICVDSAWPGITFIIVLLAPYVNTPMIAAATMTRANEAAMRDPLMPWISRRSRNNWTLALMIAVIDVPSARPRYPITRTSETLNAMFTSTEPADTM